MFEDEFFKRIRKVIEERIEREERGRKEEFWGKLGLRGISIEIRNGEGEEPQVKIRRIRERPRSYRESIRTKNIGTEKRITKMLDSSCVRIEKPREILFSMHIPGATGERIEIRRYGNALEVLARKDDGKAYFSTFELPSDAVPEERVVRVKGDILTIIVPRRRKQ